MLSSPPSQTESEAQRGCPASPSRQVLEPRPEVALSAGARHSTLVLKLQGYRHTEPGTGQMLSECLTCEGARTPKLRKGRTVPPIFPELSGPHSAPALHCTLDPTFREQERLKVEQQQSKMPRKRSRRMLFPLRASSSSRPGGTVASQGQA